MQKSKITLYMIFVVMLSCISVVILINESFAQMKQNERLQSQTDLQKPGDTSQQNKYTYSGYKILFLIAKPLHLLGLALGFGGMVAVHIVMGAYLSEECIDDAVANAVDRISLIVFLGLLILWISGLFFLINYGLNAPEKLENPKLYAKIIAVTVLSLNGFLVHKYVLKTIRESIGFTLFEYLPLSKIFLILTIGTVSTISWMYAFAFGAIIQLNFLMSIECFLLVYFATLVLAVPTSCFFVWLLKNSDH